MPTLQTKLPSARPPLRPSLPPPPSALTAALSSPLVLGTGTPTPPMTPRPLPVPRAPRALSCRGFHMGGCVPMRCRWGQQAVGAHRQVQQDERPGLPEDTVLTPGGLTGPLAWPGPHVPQDPGHLGQTCWCGLLLGGGRKCPCFPLLAGAVLVLPISGAPSSARAFCPCPRHCLLPQGRYRGASPGGEVSANCSAVVPGLKVFSLKPAHQPRPTPGPGSAQQVCSASQLCEIVSWP